MVGYIAHNIRNPLASIRAAVQVGREEAPGTRDTFQDVIDTVDRLEQWVQDLLSYMNPLRLNLAPDDLNRVVGNALAVFQNRAAEEGPRFVLDLQPLQPALTDAQWMEQVLVAVLGPVDI